MVTIERDNKVVSRSQNLRGIADYNRNVAPVVLVHIFKESDGQGYLHLEFSDGAICNTYFADYTVLKQWAERKLQRSWSGADYQYQ